MNDISVTKIFGTDGVRGLANTPPMTVETALALGRAAGRLFRMDNRKHRILIGKDTRLSCYMIENALIAGLCSMGVDTVMLGPFPTPGVAFLTRSYRADAGIVISASHNPYYDNGIKFFSPAGFKLPDDWEREMEQMVHENDFSKWLPDSDGLGKNSKATDAHGRYIEFAKATYPKHLTLRDMRIALDCANGAVWRVAPHIFEELDATVFVYGNAPNGLNINENCGALHPETIREAVLDQGCHVGIALDGDGDRVIMIDEKGNTVDGDTILAICARSMKDKGTLKNNRIVATVMSNLGFFRAMEQEGIEVIQSAVGDRNVIREMINHECNLGGEQSGHTIFLNHNTTGDGLVCALQVLAIMVETSSSLSELAALFTKYPQYLESVPVSNKPPLQELKQVQKAISNVETRLGKEGRVLVRYSGTENVCRVMVEGPTQEEVKRSAEEIITELQREIGV